MEVEHIVQDAGSGAELEAWAVGQPRLKLYVEKDKGMYDAVNRGLKRATGEILAYLNCDEQYLPGTLAKVGNFLAAHPEVDVLFGDMILVNTQLRPISYRRTVLPTSHHIKFAHLNTATCATFFRRRLLERGFYFDPQWKSIGDAVWVEKLLKAEVNMATIREPLAVFTQTGQNLGATAISRSEAARWRRLQRGSVLSTAVVVIWHRLRKAFAGAYRLRRVEIAVFTPGSPGKRQQIVGSVGFTWASN